MGPSDWFRPTATGLELRIRLTPKSGRDCLETVKPATDGNLHLGARVRAVPEDGKANSALIALIANVAGIARSRIKIVGGHASRLKTVRLDCASAEAAGIIARLAGG